MMLGVLHNLEVIKTMLGAIMYDMEHVYIGESIGHYIEEKKERCK